MATSSKVIVFGPTGAVGSAAARTAEELGATVVLAMRDPKKAVPGLEPDKEKQQNFQRVYADLTKPDTVRDAVTSTGAKNAFIYAAHSTPDHMKSTIEALKSAGIQLVVFLSSFTVRGNLKEIPPSELIPYIHAQVEINLTDVFGKDGFVALRPGSFATNLLQYKGGLANDEVKIFAPEAVVDCIVSEDIGRVSGTILAKGPQDEHRAIYLYGPELRSQVDAVKFIARSIGKNPKITVSDREQAYKTFVEERGAPPPVAKYMTSYEERERVGLTVYGYALDKEELSNVEKYSGTKAATLEEWVEHNKGLFLS